MKMKMKWIYRDRNSSGSDPKWLEEMIEVQPIKWEDLKIGDVIFIPGNLENNIPTAMYGRHRVVNPKKQLLTNGRNIFYEDWSFVYKETEAK